MTVRDELQRIAEAVLDGTATEADREQLAALLAQHPSAREVWADLEIARGALAAAQLDTPPPGLRESVMRAVAGQPLPRREAPAWWRAILASLEARPAARLTLGLAALLAVTVIGVAVMTGQFGAGRDLAPRTVATLAPPAGAPVPPGSGHPPAALASRVEVDAVREAHAIRVRGTVSGAGGSDVAITWAPDAAVIAGFRWTLGGGDAPSLAPGQVRTQVTGDASFELTLSPTGATVPDLRLTLGSGGREQVVPIIVRTR